MSEFKNKYTGEILPFRCPYNVEPDVGVENKSDDECVLSDYIPICDQIKMFTREDILKINALDTIEKELPDLDDEGIEDYISEDELDTLTDLETLQPTLFDEQEKTQATEEARTDTTNEPRHTDNSDGGAGGSAPSVSE